MKQLYRIRDNLIRSLSLNDYEISKHKFIDICEKSSIDKENIAFFGSIQFPGISDIDAIVISSAKNLQILNSYFKNTKKSSLSFSYMFWHPPLLVLDQIARESKRLHTLWNLHPIGNNTINPELEISNSNKNMTLLNIVWFSYLIKVYAKTLFNLKHNKIVDLRLLIFLYKNIYYSYKLFKNHLPVHSPPISDVMLINKILDINTDSVNFVATELKYLFKITSKYFDSYCSDKLSNNPRKPCKGFIILSKNTFVLSSNKTNITFKQNLIIIESNTYAYQLLTDYIHKSISNIIYGEYIKMSYVCIEKYHNANIVYPFITPFGTTISSPFLFFIKNFNIISNLLSYCLR